MSAGVDLTFRLRASKARIAAIGECMVEMSDRGGGMVSLGYAGDTLNSALYLARLCGDAAQVSYLTAVGVDPLSDAMLQFWRGEGIDIGAVARLEDKLPGLYM